MSRLQGRWWQAAGRAGLGCASFLFLGLPLLAVGFFGAELGWLPSAWAKGFLYGMCLSLFMLPMLRAYLTHQRLGPGSVSILGAGPVLLAGFHVLPALAALPGVVLLAASLVWDKLLLKRAKATRDEDSRRE